MDSEGQKKPQSQPQDQRQASPGAMLAAQREAMGLTIEQIADQLKLAPRQVVAIEQGDFASLPNMAVTRGFIRAYAKVVRLDPAPLVAQIEVTPSVTSTEHAPVRREKITTTFSPSRFPTLASRQSKPKVWIIGGAVALAVLAGAGAWQAGLISPGALSKPAATVAAPAATPAAPGTAATTAATPPLLSPNVPLVSTPGPATPENTAPLVTTPPAAATDAPATAPGTAATAATTPAATAPATAATPAPATPAAAAATPAAPVPSGANTLTLVFTADSWVEIKRPGASALISRLVKAGSTESFEIDRQSTLTVGAPDGVRATLRGQPLPLPKVAGGTISRVQIK